MHSYTVAFYRLGLEQVGYSRQVQDRSRPFRDTSKGRRGFVAVGIFLVFGALMAALAGTTLLWSGTGLDRIWMLNPSAHRQLAPLVNIFRGDFLRGSLGFAMAGALSSYI